MKKKFSILFFILITIVTLFSCNQGDANHSVVTFKYFGYDSYSSKYKILEFDVVVLKGRCIDADTAEALAENTFAFSGYTVVKYFEGLNSKEYKFDEKKDYLKPTVMPADAKLGRVITDLSKVPFSEDTTLYVYYSPVNASGS